MLVAYLILEATIQKFRERHWISYLSSTLWYWKPFIEKKHSAPICYRCVFCHKVWFRYQKSEMEEEVKNFKKSGQIKQSLPPVKHQDSCFWAKFAMLGNNVHTLTFSYSRSLHCFQDNSLSGAVFWFQKKNFSLISLRFFRFILRYFLL